MGGRVCIVALAMVVILPGCGSSGGKSMGAALARAAVTVAFAAVATAVEGGNRRRARRRLTEGNWGDDGGRTLPPSEPFEVGTAGPRTSSRGAPLPLYQGSAVVPVTPEDITCETDSDCVAASATCCECGHGGLLVALTREAAERMTEALSCENATCDSGALHASCGAETTCLHGLCRLIPSAILAPDPVPADHDSAAEPSGRPSVPDGY